MKILSLNLWRYYDWKKRFNNIVRNVLEKNPDVIFLQEVQLDKNVSYLSQVEILKEELKEYKYSVFSTTLVKTHQRGQKLEYPIQHGMAVLSKYPIKNSFNYFLNLAEDEKESRSILCFDIEKDKKIVKMANIHFGNREDWAKEQLEEFIHFMYYRKEQRIMAGDFNLFKMPDYQDIFEGYRLSYDFKKYKSFSESYENGKMVKKDGTLDYILIPENYHFEKLEVINEYLSDHNALYVEIV
jgi:endonuclease/exonuclease/phosphatase family metal-dependent hydrolase